MPLATDDKLNALIEAKVGEVFGQMLPGEDPAHWRLDEELRALRM